MEKEEKKTLDFGKKYRVGNFTVLKINKVLRKEELAELRKSMDIKDEDRRHLKRAQLPFIKVEAVSGIWAIEICCTTATYHMIDQLLAEGGERAELMFAHLFNMWFMDTVVSGDNEYQEAKAVALRDFMNRKAKAEEGDDSEILEEMKAEEQARADINEMAEQIGKEESK